MTTMSSRTVCNGGGRTSGKLAQGLTEFDWSMVAFVAQWERYGGPEPEEILPRFGMSCVRMREHLEHILLYVRRHPIALSPEQKVSIDHAQRWLATLDDGSPYGAPAGRESAPADPLAAPGAPIMSRGVWRWR